MSSLQELDHAREAIKAGKMEDAQKILEVIIQLEPNNPDAWEMLFTVIKNPQEKLDCLKQIVRINPTDRAARVRLKKYKAGSEYRIHHTEFHRDIYNVMVKRDTPKEILAIFSFPLEMFKILYQIISDLFTRRWMH